VPEFIFAGNFWSEIRIPFFAKYRFLLMREQDAICAGRGLRIGMRQAGPGEAETVRARTYCLSRSAS
jgi:hypothetical protein